MATFTLRPTSGTTSVAATVARVGTTNEYRLTPSAPLAASTSYTATLTGGTGAIRDLANNPLATISWAFTTAAGGGTPTTRTVPLNPVADTMIKQGAATTTFGTTTSLQADTEDVTGTASAINSFLRFDVPALQPGESITAASLSLHVSNETSNGPAVFRTDPNWSETGLTWNSPRPARTPTTSVGNFGSMPSATRATIPVSGVTAAGPVSFELQPESSNGVDFRSREYATVADRPQLVLTITTPAAAAAVGVFAPLGGTVFAPPA
jgi:hypothetical protein